jgi:DeoR/GlpR family transcriptional regulator of sugar metabolism
MGFKKKYNQAARVQGILRTLGIRQGITIGELAEEFSVTKRTLDRDLRALEDAGYLSFPRSLMNQRDVRAKRA